MKTPLNQIFYGPPGTGKTFCLAEEAERIINEKIIGEELSRVDKFERICKYLRTQYQDSIYNQLNGNNIYRNFSKSVVSLGWFLDDKYDTTNTIIHDDLKDLVGFRRSGWSQRLRYLTEFDLIEGNWISDFSGQLGKDMTLSQRGIELKNRLKKYIDENHIDKDTLKEWPRENGLPDFLINEYISILAEISPLNTLMTAFKKTILCALNMCLNSELFRQNSESRESTDDEIEIIKKYLDINESNNTDYKWIGWIAENIKDLGLIIQLKEEKDNKYFYELTERGNLLIDQVIDNWNKEFPNLFRKHIDYETSLSMGLVKFVTFHQSFSYEEFIEGIRPDLNIEDEIRYILKNGLFKDLSNKAKSDLKNNYVLIIDEINRGNISKIFGELITLIEPTKRLFATPKEYPQSVQLPYSKKLFGIPNNLYLIGTMNTADRSITNIDTALRRRFVFKEFSPLYDHEKIGIVVKDGHTIDLKVVLKVINKRIEYLLDRDHLIGHSFFMDIKDWGTLCDNFRDNLIPLLQEYFYNDWGKIALVLGDNDLWNKSESEKFIQLEKYSPEKLFGKGYNMEDDSKENRYFINPDLLNRKYHNLSVNFFIKGFIE